MTRRFARLRVDGREWFAAREDDSFWLLDGPPHREDCRRTGERVAAEDAELLAPVAPTKIVCIGRNYRAHAAELGNAVPSEPLLFLKPPSAVIGPGDDVVIPPVSRRVEHEVELGLVIGRRASAVDERDALGHVFGFTVVGDITARDLQQSDKTWTRGKGFDTFCPVGPLVVTGLDVGDLAIRCTVNGELRQRGTTGHMVFSPAALVSYISHVMTLEPGDVVATGTPEGVGPLVPGDRVLMSIDGIGELTFGVRAR